ncbi:MAG: hypothetical protein HQK75_07610, partial [Candidatus Magnetomorum sp.]|nr:hypothetical protein [Candidatus Magnetomorum sp.]
DVSGNTRLYQPLGSSGYALSVTGETYMEGNLSVSGTLITDMIDVAHITYSATPLDVSRDIMLNGNMSLTPLSPFNTALNVYGNTEIYQPNLGYGYALSVTGDSFMDGNLNVSGTLITDMIDVAHITYS